MSNKIQLRRGTDAARGTVVLDSGEPGWSTDTKKLYVGDGETYGGVLVTGAGAGDMYKGTYDKNDSGTVDNSERLENNTLGSVQAHTVAAAKITSGTIGLSRIPTIDDAHIPDLETLSYGGTFAGDQIPNLPTTKTTSGTFGLVRIPSIDNAHLAGGITSDKIPALDGTAITYPLNADSIGTTQIESGGVANDELAASGLDISKFTIGTAGVDRIPSLPAGRVTSGTFGLSRIPTIDDAHIPDLETLSYGAAFGTAQMPDLSASKITSGTFGLARIPGTLTGKDADSVDGADAGVVANTVFKLPAGIAQGDIFHVNAGGSVVKLTAGTSGHFLKTQGAGTNPQWSSVPGGGDMLKNVYDTGDNSIVDNSERLENNTLGSVQAHTVAAAKITSGTIGLSRIPTIDDAHIPDLETLSYGAAFGTAQMPSVGAYKITTGTFNALRIPTLPNLIGTLTDAKIPNLETLSYGAAFADGQIPNLPTSKTTTGTFNINRIQTLDVLKGTVSATKVASLDADKITSGTFNSDRVPILPTDRYGSAVLVSGTRSMAGDFDFAKHQAKAMALEALGSAPASPATAQLYYNTGDDKVYVYVA